MHYTYYIWSCEAESSRAVNRKKMFGTRGNAYKQRKKTSSEQRGLSPK